MYLLYINSLNRNHRGEIIYEFLFGRGLGIEYGDNWDVAPANTAEITPPPLNYVHKVGLLITDQIELECIQQSEYFCVLDAVDDVIAIAWELEPQEGTPRLVFHFGETMESVKDKLFSRDLELNMESTNKYATTDEKN